jgi:hypothetical protein
MYKADRLYQEILDLEKAAEAIVVDGPESLTEYARLLTTLIFTHKEIGNVYDLYADDVVVYRENGYRLVGSHEVMKDLTVFLSAFPDLCVNYADSFAVKKGDVYKLWRHFNLDGHNLGHSVYGPPTGKELGGPKCIVMNMATVAITDGKPKIVKEFTMYSSDWIRAVCGG